MRKIILGLSCLYPLVVLGGDDNAIVRQAITNGCYQDMIGKGNSVENAKRFCTCFASTLVNNMTEAELDMMAEPERLKDVVSRNHEKLNSCEAGMTDVRF